MNDFKEQLRQRLSGVGTPQSAVRSGPAVRIGVQQKDLVDSIDSRVAADKPSPTEGEIRRIMANENVDRETAVDRAYFDAGVRRVKQQEQPDQMFVFDQYDGAALGFYVEIAAPTLEEATARLKDLVSDQTVREISLGSVGGKNINARITFHPSGVRPTYFKRRRFI